MDARRCSWAALPLRLAFGFGMVYHGYPKLFSAEQHTQFVGMLGGMGIPLPELSAWALGALEFFGGLLIMIGALVAILSALFVVEMLVALFLVHLPYGFANMNPVGTMEGAPVFGMPGYEVNVLYIAGFLALLLTGAGRYSVDALVRRPARGEWDAARPPRRTEFPQRAPSWRKRSGKPTESS